MRLISVLSIIMFLTVLSLSAQTDNEDYELAKNYFKEANVLKQRYDFVNSRLYFEKAAELFKKYNYTGNYIQCQYSVADICIHNNNFKTSEQLLNEIEQLAIDKYGENNNFLINIYYGQGMVMASKGKHNDAISLYNKY